MSKKKFDFMSDELEVTPDPVEENLEESVEVSVEEPVTFEEPREDIKELETKNFENPWAILGYMVTDVKVNPGEVQIELGRRRKLIFKSNGSLELA